jgi:hypothetical protein
MTPSAKTLQYAEKFHLLNFQHFHSFFLFSKFMFQIQQQRGICFDFVKPNVCSFRHFLSEMSSDTSVHFKLSDFIIHVTKRLGAAVTFLTHIWEVLGSNLGRITGYPD